MPGTGLKTLKDIKISLPVLGAILLMTLIYNYNQRLKHPSVEHVQTNVRYQSVPACDADKVNSMYYIPDACVVPKYHIDNYAEYGLEQEYRGARWYRIANDAFFINCDPVQRNCIKIYRKKGFFLVN